LLVIGEIVYINKNDRKNLSMNLRDFRYLLALDRHRHFGRAAKACFVSQPTLSGQIKKLEDQLGVQLLERAHKSVVMTLVGQQIVARARVMMAEVAAIEAIAKAAGDPLAGEFRIGVIPTLGPYLLGLLVPAILARMPAIKPILVEDQTARVTERLNAGELDAVILATPVAETEGLRVTPVFFEPFMLALPAGHVLRKRRYVAIEDIDPDTLLLLDDGHCLRQHALAFCQWRANADADRFRATSLETLRYMIASNAGISLFPTLAVEHAVAASNPAVAYRPFKPVGPGREISVVWRPQSAREVACFALVDAIRHCGIAKAWLRTTRG
jgi:LysR family transcriptional regulator, hydrogen peroxide-inducible genes activator